jgi:hypothetical protein
MTEIRNSVGKLVCRVDTKNLTIEVVRKGIRTIVYLVPNGKPIVLNNCV